MAKVLILDDDADLRELLGDFLSSLSSSCVLAGALGDLQQRADEVLACDLAILDINLGPGQPSGVEACRWLIEHGFGGRIVFLTGHAASSTPCATAAGQMRNAQVLEKPLDTSRLVELVQGCS